MKSSVLVQPSLQDVSDGLAIAFDAGNVIGKAAALDTFVVRTLSGIIDRDVGGARLFPELGRSP